MTGPLSFILISMALAGQVFAKATLLSETGLYSQISSHTISSQVKEYNVQYPLWSDGALKRRFIFIPPGQKINTRDGNWWSFPVGTKLWKEFSYDKQGHFKRIETRLLQREASGWKMSTYLWNDDDTEATEDSGRGRDQYVELRPGVFHNVPSQGMCLICHETQGSDPVLGFQALQLAHSEPGMNLEILKKENLITHPVGEVVIKSETVAGRKALGLMHGNCAHCHNPKGFEGDLDMNLRHDINTTTPAQENAYRTTVLKNSRYIFPDYDVSLFRILPKKPEQSILYRRVKASAHDDVNFMERMPPGNFGNTSVNQELVDSLADWINSL